MLDAGWRKGVGRDDRLVHDKGAYYGKFFLEKTNAYKVGSGGNVVHTCKLTHKVLTLMQCVFGCGFF